MIIIISYVLVFIAAFFKACADAFENTPNFDESIFKNWNKKFWCKDVSWQYAKKLSIKIPFINKRVGSYKFDSWHLSISAMIFCMDGAMVIHFPDHNFFHFVGIGVLWNIVFVGFYHKIFGIK